MARVRPVCVRTESRQPFLEPPHCHDPTAVCLVGLLPPSVMTKIPFDIQEALWDIRESASVAHASYDRLLDLLDERFDRLMPHVGSEGPSFSESSWFNYDNQLRAEWEYLSSEAVPDLQHKAAQINPALQPFFDISLPPSVSEHSMSLEMWWQALQTSISEWVRQTRTFEIPQFEETVEDYLAGRHEDLAHDAKERSPSDAPTVQDGLLTAAPSAAVSRHDGIDMQPNELAHVSPVVCSKAAGITIKPLGPRKDPGITLVFA